MILESRLAVLEPAFLCPLHPFVLFYQVKGFIGCMHDVFKFLNRIRKFLYAITQSYLNIVNAVPN